MKNRLLCLLLTVLLVVNFVFSASAETYHGDSNWRVNFTTSNKLESTFKSSDLDDAIAGMQPGDNIIIELKLQNDNSETTDWYMTNEVLYSLEDRSNNKATGSGAYTYNLTYTDNTGAVTSLFSSDTVGGDDISAAGEGLHEATNALKDYFFLDTLDQGQGGIITLEVALDGETQGNDYQDTLADLQMNFAVELRNRKTTEVKTGDEFHPAMYVGAGVASVVILAIISITGRKKQEDEL